MKWNDKAISLCSRCYARIAHRTCLPGTWIVMGRALWKCHTRRGDDPQKMVERYEFFAIIGSISPDLHKMQEESLGLHWHLAWRYRKCPRVPDKQCTRYIYTMCGCMPTIHVTYQRPSACSRCFLYATYSSCCCGDGVAINLQLVCCVCSVREVDGFPHLQVLL